mgnify:CR=1 FL=1
MKRLTENQFEEIFKKYKDLEKISDAFREETIKYHSEDEERIYKEWWMYHDENYLISSADYIIKSNDDNEPYTTARICRKLNICESLANVVLECINNILDGEIAPLTNKEKCIDSLRSRVEMILSDNSLEEERKQLIREELEGICEYGDPETMIAACSITKVLRATNHYYYVKGPIASSLIAYHLKIHNVDCYKHHIDYRKCHGDNFEKRYQVDIISGQQFVETAHKWMEELYPSAVLMKEYRSVIWAQHGLFSKKKLLKIKIF